jgi:hypothetical protein
MPLENLTGNRYINSLNETWPDGAIDTPDAGDDHLRGIKNVLKKTFPGMNGPVTRDLASLNRGSVPVGSLTVFYNATAPVGWTRATAASTFMLRVVSNAMSGAASGGSDDPILNNKVATHAHTYSGDTVGTSNDHTHTFSATTGAQSSDHTHGSGSLAAVSNGAHTHTYSYRNSTQARASGGAGAFWEGTVTANSGSDGAHTHSISGSTGGISAGHTHTVSGTTGGHSAQHTHAFSGTTAANASASNWTPRYLDVILCSRTS